MIAPGGSRPEADCADANRTEAYSTELDTSASRIETSHTPASADVSVESAPAPAILSPEPPPSQLSGDATASSFGPIPAASLTAAASQVVDVRDLDWQEVRNAVDAPAIRARLRFIVEQMELLLDSVGGPGMLFDGDRADAADRAIQVSTVDRTTPTWIVGDLHGDLLALEAALTLIRDHALQAGQIRPRIILLGDLFDDEGFGFEVLLRVFELILEAPASICLLAGNHDEALSYDGARFASSVAPSDFTDFLNANLAHEWIERAGKLAVRLFAKAPRALFFPDGLLVSHGGFPLVDLHQRLVETGDWNDPACLSDFVWTRAHPTARKKLPNRFSRGCQFGYEDFAAFCSLSGILGRRVTHMVRGHDHIEERYAIYPAYHAHPVLTTVALARRLNRERLGSYPRIPTVARVVEGALPQVYRLHVPANIVLGVYSEPDVDNDDEATVEARI